MKKNDFIERFIEVCDSSQPTEISKLLDISYQAAKNYLEGRYPDANVLIKIAERTPYSLNWLLTGKGKKFVEKREAGEFDSLLTNLQKFVGVEFIQMFDQFLENYPGKIGHTSTVSPRTVKLKVTQIKQEREKERESSNLPGKED